MINIEYPGEYESDSFPVEKKIGCVLPLQNNIFGLFWLKSLNNFCAHKNCDFHKFSNSGAWYRGLGNKK